jgi:hypothetical protein
LAVSLTNRLICRSQDLGIVLAEVLEQWTIKISAPDAAAVRAMAS